MAIHLGWNLPGEFVHPSMGTLTGRTRFSQVVTGAVAQLPSPGVAPAMPAQAHAAPRPMGPGLPAMRPRAAVPAANLAIRSSVARAFTRSGHPAQPFTPPAAMTARIQSTKIAHDVAATARATLMQPRIAPASAEIVPKVAMDGMRRLRAVRTRQPGIPMPVVHNVPQLGIRAVSSPQAGSALTQIRSTIRRTANDQRTAERVLQASARQRMLPTSLLTSTTPGWVPAGPDPTVYGPSGVWHRRF